MTWKGSRQESHYMSRRQPWKCIIPTLKQSMGKDKTNLTPHCSHSKSGLTHRPVHLAGDAKQDRLKARWINGDTNFRERWELSQGPCSPCMPREVCVPGREPCSDAGRVKPEWHQRPAAARIARPAREKEGNIPSVAQHRLVETFN